MPQWVKEHILRPLAKVLCVRRNTRVEDTGKYLDPGSFCSNMRNRTTSYNSSADFNGLSKQNGGHDVDRLTDGGSGILVDRRTSPLSVLFDEVRVITSLITDQNIQDEIEEEWQCLAKIFDRVFFVTFLFIFLVSSVVLLQPVYQG